MASPGLLVLLLILSSLLISTVSNPTSSDQNHLEEVTQETSNKVKEGFKASGKFVVKNIDQIRFTVVPFLSLIPVYGPLISAIATLALVGVNGINKNLFEKSDFKTIMDEFKNLNTKLDDIHAKQKWESWASGAYHKPEKKIKVAWESFVRLPEILRQAADENERKRHREEFMQQYQKYESATSDLHLMLTAKGTTFINNMGKALGEHVNCHEKDIRNFIVLISTLIFQGNTMNQFYNRLKDIESPVKVNEQAKIAYECAVAMFKILKECISQSMTYVKKDVEGLIDNNKDRHQLAKDVRFMLETTYDRYDWIVVAFTTKNSKHKILEGLNKHVLSGFTEVTKEDTSVAVARQLKGKHTKAHEVGKAIKECLKSVECHKVPEQLKKCKQKVGTTELSKTYSAVHAFTKSISKSHDSADAKDVKEAPEDEYVNPEAESQTPYIYTGKCKDTKISSNGHFRVLIRSDDEITGKSPCDSVDCGKKGKCVLLDNNLIPVCECEKNHYGEKCEDSVDGYKDSLNEKMPEN